MPRPGQASHRPGPPPASYAGRATPNEKVPHGGAGRPSRSRPGGLPMSDSELAGAASGSDVPSHESEPEAPGRGQPPGPDSECRQAAAGFRLSEHSSHHWHGEVLGS